MTATTPAAREYAEIVVCVDCTMILVNGDSSGIEDADAHLARMDATLAGYGPITVIDSADLGMYETECGACGELIMTDAWFAAEIDLVPAEPVEADPIDLQDDAAGRYVW